MRSDISEISKDLISVMGSRISDLMESSTVASLVLVMSGVYPTPKNEKIINMLIVGFVDHGLSPPSTISARLAASCGSDLTKCLISALSCMGDLHAPISHAYEFFENCKETSINTSIKLYKRIPGFGHPIHSRDPRVAPLLEAMGPGFFCDIAKQVEASIGVPMNYAGATAAICLDLGVSKESAHLIGILGRMIGISAHVAEQKSYPQKVICYDADTRQFIE